MLIRKKENHREQWDHFFQNIFINVEDTLIAADMQSDRIEYVSSNAEKMLGIRREIKGAASALFKQIGMIHAPDLMLLKDKRKKAQEGYVINIQTGREIWCRCSWTFFKMYAELEEKIIVNISDCSRERADIDKMCRMLEETKKSNEAKSRFLTTVTHDMRTPMNVILGLTELAMEHLENRDKVQEYLYKISRSSTHLVELSNDVLDMSRIESGCMQIGQKSFNLRELLADVQGIIQEQANIKNHTLAQEWYLEHDRVIGDPVRLRQILINLLSNAVKYTQDGGSLLFRVQETGSDEARAYYEIKIADNGCGMSKEFLEIVFEPFTKERNKGTEEIEGSGLGMSITKNLVELMGGHLSVESRPGEGTVFSVEIPFLLHKGASEEQEEMGEDFCCRGKRILLAEDNEIAADVLKDILKAMGAEVDWACNGKAAVEMFGNMALLYDLILMDVQMPQVDGYEATRQIRSTSPAGEQIPIIALTGNAFKEDIKASKQAGMNHHISKPVKKKELEKVLRKLLTN